MQQGVWGYYEPPVGQEESPVGDCEEVCKEMWEKCVFDLYI